MSYDDNMTLSSDDFEDENSSPLIVEVSYCYLASAVKACNGHWDKDLNWHQGAIWPQDAIMEDMLARIDTKKQGK